MKKDKILIMFLVVVIVVLFLYVVIDNYNESKQEKENVLLQQGAQLGYEQAIAQIVQQAVTCQQIPITFQNQTINLIAVECLQPAQ